MSAEGSIRGFRAVAVAAALSALVVFGVAPAIAQTTSTTSYVTPTTASPCPGLSQDLGTLNVGQTASGTVGGFNGSSNTTGALNGTDFGTIAADANGCVTVTVTPTAAGSALGLRIIAVQGVRLAATGSTVTINGVTGLTAKAPGQQNVITISGTGTGGTVTRSVLFKVNGPGVSGNSLSRTGVMILRWTIAGVVLIALGIAVLMLNRRRHSGTEAAS